MGPVSTVSFHPGLVFAEQDIKHIAVDLLEPVIRRNVPLAL